MTQNDLRDRLKAKSTPAHEGSNKPRIPTIKLDGSSTTDTAGSFMLYDNDTATNLGDKIKLRIIRTKKKLLSANDTFKMFTGEYDSPSRDEIRLSKQVYENKGGKPEAVATGTAQKLREMFPDLKVVTVAYGLLDGKLVRLTVKGASTTGDTGLYDYLSSFQGDSAMFYDTKIKSTKVQKNRAISYFRMEFMRGEQNDSDLEQVEKYLDMINGVESAPEEVVETKTEATDEELEAW